MQFHHEFVLSHQVAATVGPTGVFKIAVVEEQPPHWHPPQSDYIKLNFDGAFLKDGKRGEVGIICRDYRGCALECKSNLEQNCSGAMLVEALGLREGSHFSKG
ncbi:conserved hypothetical protein [Ricinus communis]|uniref:RNase H type-1 domain-containing protein n=1 Tax=Ricinus communis TaxID=3988 RepID=B9RVL1_RICCO|nr:conserved hypothetical protein [Ricinus communis]